MAKQWITEHGKLTMIFEKALDRENMKGKVVAAMNPANCAKIGNWMVDNVPKWHEPGKNIKIEGRMMIDVLRRRGNAKNKSDIKECATIVNGKLSKLEATPRKKK